MHACIHTFIRIVPCHKCMHAYIHSYALCRAINVIATAEERLLAGSHQQDDHESERQATGMVSRRQLVFSHLGSPSSVLAQVFASARACCCQ